MKKIISTALAITMLLSLAVVFATPTAAVDGDWHVLPRADALLPEYDGDPPSLAGYEYTDRGFHTVPTDAWQESNPYVMTQTKNKVDLKEGVYLEIEIDTFTYKNDKWFNLNIWDSVSLHPGSGNSATGAGVQTIIRPSDSNDANNLQKAGSLNRVAWYTEQFANSGASTVNGERNKTTEDGDPILCMTLTWDGSTYALDINGAAAPTAVITFMNKKWGGDDSEAYIGFYAQNGNKGGTVEYTITKFGTSASSATTPMGDDSAEPTNELIPKAEIADPSTVPANEPAIFLNADRNNSDTKSKPTTGNGGFNSINDDFSLHIAANTPVPTLSAANFTVKNEVSYDIKDFPVAITLTRNFCTCGKEDGSCDALEAGQYYIMAGENLATSSDYKTAILDMCYDSYAIENADGKTDTYLYFFCDFTNEFGEPLEGRINGIRFDAAKLNFDAETGINFDIMFIAFFRNADEAKAYVENYLKDLGWEEETTVETTEETTEVTTEETTVETTEETTEEKTENKSEQTTEKSDETEKPEEGGCASVIGFSAVAAVAAVAACGTVAFRKRED